MIPVERETVKRKLKGRMMQMYALGGTIGTGLFVGIGGGLAQAGPLSLLLGYSITSIFIFSMMRCLGEMTTWLPLPGATPRFCSRFVDDALGFAVGWNQWYNCAITVCAEISAAAAVIQFWNDTISPAVWISIILVLIFIFNLIDVGIFGEVEFVFSCVKIVALVGLLILSLVIDLGGGPTHDRLGFRYWNNPGAMVEYIVSGDTGRFLGLFNAIVNAGFAFAGIEMIAVAAGETENPRHNIPKAVNRLFWRIIFFYVLGTLAIGVIVPYTDDRLLNGGAGVASSPWVIGITRAGIKVLPSIINAVVLMSAASAGNALLYSGSRYLLALAEGGQAPRFLLKCTKRGVPIYCVLATGSLAPLTYMAVSSDSARVFSWFANLVTTAALFTWCSICIAYIGFDRALRAQGIDRKGELAFGGVFQPYLSWASLGFFIIVIIFNGFSVFIHGHWDTQKFVVAYVGIPIFFTLFFGWKVIKKTKFRSSREIDLDTGRQLDESTEYEGRPKNLVERLWAWAA
ncbi:amino acid transporter [Trichoderma reesei QM6a]|uniref:Amino acid transporter n=2 Tax=Hypocrea jecorina TaxID=51453 RepID=G0RRI4_HYPJQ|nr:amino acid transporter [Trichoderma reesei QM6a]EGR46158.1 amino acid transporter [Trichoderma reesei QM6a]ETR99299.1 amino acid permease [Trichoderma reesei RUT C-30]